MFRFQKKNWKHNNLKTVTKIYKFLDNTKDPDWLVSSEFAEIEENF